MNKALPAITRLFRIGILFAFLVLSCAADNDYPQNIILFIGDGMGVGHITAEKIVAGGHSHIPSSTLGAASCRDMILF